jgi:hypothetical protein
VKEEHFFRLGGTHTRKKIINFYQRTSDKMRLKLYINLYKNSACHLNLICNFFDCQNLNIFKCQNLPKYEKNNLKLRQHLS